MYVDLLQAKVVGMLFIHLFAYFCTEQFSGTLILLYRSIVLCINKGDISVAVIFHLSKVVF